MSHLVIVESPAKARTLSRFLGKDYTLKASLGHIRDLPQKAFGVDVGQDFSPEYQLIPGKNKVVQEIKEAARDAQKVFLATDPDREGEAIAWHLTQAIPLDGKNGVARVVFHEITEEAVKQAFRHPRPLDIHLVQAQQARRILDRLVGYKLSPLLWKKVGKGLSAGRVQSAALRLVVDREREFQAFVPQEYWTIEVEFLKEATPFRARFVGWWGGDKIPLPNQEAAAGVEEALKASAFSVGKVLQRELRRHPAPPFITSTLQQDAYRKLSFAAEYTMRLAQQLYEGLEIGPQGAVGLITYMRTDSTRVSASALAETRDYIASKFGPDYLPAKARVFGRVVKGAQEAHEAIRPTGISREPDSLRPYLNTDQLKLYELIWKRMVASQMSPVRYDTTTVDIEARPPSRDKSYLLRATGSVLRFPGFTRLYIESQEEPEETTPPLPPLKVGERLKPQGFFPQQHFTQPPPRYSEASLIKALEERGIGRPSTYAPILSVLRERGYVARQAGKLHPQPVGMAVADLLREHFPDIVDLDFTAQMEARLDAIARGETEWLPVVQNFYTPFEHTLRQAAQAIPRVVVETGEKCPTCGRPLTVKQGRYGPFVACSGYPECRYKPAIKAEAGQPQEAQETGEKCPSCGKPLVVRRSRFGPFLSCSGYPECTYKRPYVLKTGATCPQCGGEIGERVSKKGRTFFGCLNYPRCRFATRYRPLPQPCPQCGGLLVSRGQGGAYCLKEECQVDLAPAEEG